MKIKKKARAQGGFEYVLIVAAVLFAVVAAVFMTRGGVIQPAARDIALADCLRQLASSSECYENGKLNPYHPAPEPLPNACESFRQRYNELVTNCGGDAMPILPTATPPSGTPTPTETPTPTPTGTPTPTATPSPTPTDSPSVIVLSPNGGEVWSGVQTIRWTATDPNPGDVLTIAVQIGFVHPVQGVQWLDLASGLPNTGSFSVSTNNVPDNSLYLINVTARDQDGNEASDVSDGTLTVVNNRYPRILANQVGYRPTEPKTAVIELLQATRLSDATVELIDESSSAVVWSGQAVFFGDEYQPYYHAYYTVDFSEFVAPGKYHLRIKGEGINSFPFDIADTFSPEPWHLSNDFYLPAVMCGASVTTADYFNPSKTFSWHGACHTDDARQPAADEQAAWCDGSLDHILQQNPFFPVNAKIDVSGGWHEDATYHKFMGATPFGMVLLGLAVEEFNPQRDVYSLNPSGSPPSVAPNPNTVPDLVEQLKWGLQWMFKMQQNNAALPDDYGSVFERVYAPNCTGYSGMPENEANFWSSRGYPWPRSLDTDRWTDHTAEFANAAAIASRALRPYDAGLADETLERAEKAWAWVQAHPNQLSDYPYDHFHGSPDTPVFAAIELYLTTGDASYLNYVQKHIDDVDLYPSGYGGWPVLELARLYPSVSGTPLGDTVLGMLNQHLTSIRNGEADSPFGVWLWYTGGPYPMGNNERLLGTAADLYWMSKALDDAFLKNEMRNYIGWILGRNPAGYSFMSGVGTQFPDHIINNLAYNKGGWIPGAIVPGVVKTSTGPLGFLVYEDDSWNPTHDVAPWRMREAHFAYVPLFIFDTLATTPPVISGASATQITKTSAVVSWATDERADGAVDFGLTTGYGLTVEETDFSIAHSITLTGLDAGTTYHYRVTSTDAGGNAGYSQDASFTTLS